MKKRGAYFFVLDALLGGAIFLISVVMIMGSYMNVPQTKQSYVLAEDLMNVLLNTKVIEFRDPFIQYLADNGNITNPEQTLFQQIAELHYKDEDNLAFNLTRNILDSLLPEQYGVSYIIMEEDKNTTIYNRSIDRINISKFTISSKKITFFAINQTDYFGPDITELKIWN
ncbi:MAG: hypothetical protein H8D38_05450 [DPANN group archaeon]|nr:hypothetical protein [DPANN group archaeon]